MEEGEDEYQGSDWHRRNYETKHQYCTVLPASNYEKSTASKAIDRLQEQGRGCRKTGDQQRDDQL